MGDVLLIQKKMFGRHRLGVAVAAWLVLIFADRVAWVLGKTGISVAGRVMGFLLVAIATDLLAAGLVQAFPNLAANR